MWLKINTYLSGMEVGKKCFLLGIYFIAFMLSSQLKGQHGEYFYTYFPPESYHSPEFPTSPQNWQIEKDGRGLLYVVNTSCILEYDGRVWDKVNGTHYLSFHKIIRGSDGKIYVAATDDFGVLEPDSMGFSTYRSLKTAFIPEDKILGKPSWITCEGDRIWVLYRNHIFCIGPEPPMFWEQKDAKFASVFGTGNRVFVQDFDIGIKELIGNTWQLVPGSESFSKKKIFEVTVGKENELRVFTNPSQLWVQKSGEFERTNAKITPNEIMSISRIPGDRYFVTEFGTDITIVDMYGNAIQRFSNGSSKNKSPSLSTFFEGNVICVALSEGLSFLEYPSMVTIFDQMRGLDGIPVTIQKWRGKYYVGTVKGLFVSEYDPAMPDNLRFRKIEGFDKHIMCLITHPDYMIVSGVGGVFITPDGVHFTKIFGSMVTSMAPVRSDSSKVLLGLDEGVRMMERKQGKWEVGPVVEGVNFPVYAILEDEHRVFWVADEVLAKVDFNVSPPAVVRFGETEGITPEMDIFRPALWKDEIVFGTGQGLFKWDAKGNKLVPFTDFGPRFAGSGNYAFNLVPFGEKVFLESNQKIGLMTPNGHEWEWDTVPFQNMPATDTWFVYPEGNEGAWICTNAGLIRYLPESAKESAFAWKTLIRRVMLEGDSVIYGGAGPGKNPHLPYQDRNITFRYGSTWYRSPDKVMFKTFLEGYDDAWSNWSREVRKDYTNLSEGQYVFHVIARNKLGEEGEEATYRFMILRPWFRSWWAYTGYALLGLLMILISFALFSRRLRMQKAKLERIVKERTAEVTRQKGEIELEKKKSDSLLLNILPQSTAEELKKEGKAQTRSYESVSVMFTDFADFSRLASNLSPQELVEEIDTIYRQFDQIITAWGIEKIKTIGDSYMCAGGLPDALEDHALRVVGAALEICAVMEKVNQQQADRGKPIFQIRVGVHSGPVVAGVVGEIKYAYDIWGDTVNIAARMESSGQIGKVNISGDTVNLIWKDYFCRYRGAIPAKNIGKVDMYFVEGKVEDWIPATNSFRFAEMRIAVLSELKKGLSHMMFYHHFGHMLGVEAAAAKLIQHHPQLTEEERVLILTGAIFHDTGLMQDYKNHEEASAEFLRKYLQDYPYSKEQIEIIARMILATKIPQNPQNLMEQILCDADLFYLGTSDYHAVAEGLYLELLSMQTIQSRGEWQQMQLKFLENHQFHTEYARQLLMNGKNEVVKSLYSLDK